MVVVSNPVVRGDGGSYPRAMGARHVLEIGTVAEARSRAGAGVADIVVAEAGLPDESGIALVRELRAAGWQRGMVIATSDDPCSVRAAVGAGVRCYLVSASPPGHPPGERAGDGVTLSAREIRCSSSSPRASRTRTSGPPSASPR